MKKMVWKYPIKLGYIPTPHTVVDMAPNSKIIHVDVQNHQIAIWVEATDGPETEKRTFTIVGTGRVVKETWVHVGSVLDGDFAWHVYEVL